MAINAHNFYPPGYFALGFLPDDDRRHEVYARPTPDAADSLVLTLWPGDDPNNQTLILGGPNTERYVHARAFSRVNVRDIEQLGPKLRRVAYDGDGELILPVPNAPIGLTLTPAAGGVIVAAWAYSSLNQAVAPATFRVYVAEDDDPFDFDAPAATGIPAIGFRGSASLTFAHGTDTRWVVRAVSAAGAEEQNTNEATATADAQAPNAPAAVITRAP